MSLQNMEKLESDYSNALKNFKPEFGNAKHIKAVELIRRIDMPSTTKSNREDYIMQVIKLIK